MPKKTVQPYSGPLAVDITSLNGTLFDLRRGGMQRLRREKKGIAGVLAELAQSVPGFGAAAGISADVYTGFLATSDKITKIRAARAVVAKLAEVLEESEVLHEHDRENEISRMVDMVKSTAHRKDDSILAPFEKMLKYNAQSAEKSVKTRRRNQAAAEAEGAEEEEAEEEEAEEEAEEEEAPAAAE